MEGFWKQAVALRAWQLHQAGPTLLGVAGRRSWQGGCFRCYDRCDDDDPVPFAGGHRCAHEGGGTARPGPLWQMAGPRSMDDEEAYLEAHSSPETSPSHIAIPQARPPSVDQHLEVLACADSSASAQKRRRTAQTGRSTRCWESGSRTERPCTVEVQYLVDVCACEREPISLAPAAAVRGVPAWLERWESPWQRF
jgi:hypothetical protein